MRSRSSSLPARAFTLFEVAISLALVAVCVTSVLMLFPAGIKAQQHARFRILASAKMLELIDMFNTANDGNPSMDHEGCEPWDVVMAYRSRSFDLESLVPSHRSGIAPLPVELARRFDSEGDEIAKLLDEGGYLYYAQPQMTGNFDEHALPQSPASEAQRLVFAVTGYAQENGLYALPWKSWPYYATYPGPPYHVHHRGDFYPSAPAAGATDFGAPEFNPVHCYLWEATQDADVQKVFCWPADPASVSGDITRCYGYMPYAYPTPNPYHLPPTNSAERRSPPTRDGCIRYVQAALWYAKAKGLTAADWQPTTTVAPLPAGADPVVTAQRVRALRFLAHAATSLTRWYDKGALDAGVDIPSVQIDPSDPTLTSPAARYTHDAIVLLHDNCLRLCDDYCANFPYDWGALRPIENTIMMDHPLIQWDCFGPLHTGQITGDGHSAQQWKPISGSPVTSVGHSISYPALPLDGIWGTNEHFSLAAPFAADERCRQVVFWAVDWQAYEDFETAPSAPLDASRYLKGAPQFRDGQSSLKSMADMMASHDWVDGEIWNYRNPEKAYLFFAKVEGDLTGTDESGRILGISGYEQDKGLWEGNTDPNAASPQNVFAGRFGADRNFNHRLDCGPLPRSARLRAVTVARFNYYDPRVHQCLR